MFPLEYEYDWECHYYLMCKMYFVCGDGSQGRLKKGLIIIGSKVSPPYLGCFSWWWLEEQTHELFVLVSSCQVKKTSPPFLFFPTEAFQMGIILLLHRSRTRSLFPTYILFSYLTFQMLRMSTIVIVVVLFCLKGVQGEWM